MPIIRRRLQASDVYPDDIRYNPTSDKVEVLVDGEWVEAPESDPRKQTTLPPRVVDNPRCDGAQSVADALENQINSIATAIDNAQTVAQIAALVLGLFSFGLFAIFINIALAIAGYMLDAGTAAIEAALPPSAYDTLACILYCHMDASGRIKDLPEVQSELTSQIGGLGAGVLNQMLSLAGEGGVNNLAAAGTSTGDCDECGCDLDLIYVPAAAGEQVTPGSMIYQGGSVWRLTLGTRDFAGDLHSSAGFKDVSDLCFTVTNIQPVNNSYTRQYRDLCGGGSGFGAILDANITKGVFDRYLASPQVQTVVIDITAVP